MKRTKMPDTDDTEEIITIELEGDADNDRIDAECKRQRAVLDRTELQIADRLVREHGDKLRYCAALGGWFYWDAMQWVRDESGRARELAKAVARDLAQEATALMDAQLFAAAKRAGSAAGVRAVLDLASSDPLIAFTPDQADADPWALNCLNGTIDLRTGELREHSREDLITRVCNASYDAKAKAPRFRQFLEEVQPDPATRFYLRRLFGFAAIGAQHEHVFPVLYGPGANGKSQFTNALSHALGSYCKGGPESLVVLSGGNHEPHPADVALCAGARLVIVQETRTGAIVDSAKVKRLTGGDGKITARFMHGNFFEFKPGHALMLVSNFKPRADANDDGFWRRAQLVPFSVVIPLEDQDPMLGEKLRAEADGILAWIVKGALDWQERGMRLAPPQTVVAQTAEYRSGEDVIGQFIDEACTCEAKATTKAGALFDAYKSWCGSTGARWCSNNEFAAELLRRGFKRRKTKNGAVYSGIAVVGEDG